MPAMSRLERDYRRVRRGRRLRCAVCGEPVTGKAYRVEEGRYACNRCNNEVPGQ